MGSSGALSALAGPGQIVWNRPTQVQPTFIHWDRYFNLLSRLDQMPTRVRWPEFREESDASSQDPSLRDFAEKEVVPAYLFDLLPYSLQADPGHALLKRAIRLSLLDAFGGNAMRPRALAALRALQMKDLLPVVQDLLPTQLLLESQAMSLEELRHQRYVIQLMIQLIQDWQGDGVDRGASEYWHWVTRIILKTPLKNFGRPDVDSFATNSRDVFLLTIALRTEARNSYYEMDLQTLQLIASEQNGFFYSRCSSLLLLGHMDLLREDILETLRASLNSSSYREFRFAAALALAALGLDELTSHGGLKTEVYQKILADVKSRISVERDLYVQPILYWAQCKLEQYDDGSFRELVGRMNYRYYSGVGRLMDDERDRLQLLAADLVDDLVTANYWRDQDVNRLLNVQLNAEALRSTRTIPYARIKYTQRLYQALRDKYFGTAK